jgi:hypothetical protein
MIKKKKNKHSQGFSLLEVVLYIALTTIVVGIIFSYGWNMISARTKAATVRETMAGTRLISERLRSEIHAAQDVNIDTPGKLVLATEAGEVTIQAVDDKISIKRGSNDPQFLHSDNVRVRNFELHGQVSGGGKTQYVGFSFDAEAYYPEALNRYEYEFSMPFHSGAEIRI